MKTDQNEIQKLVSMIKDIKFAMLTTVSEEGTIHSRPMATLKIDDFDGNLWFFSRKNSLKNHNIAADQHVNLSYVNPDKHHYASLCGQATISDDSAKMKKFWNPSLKEWFPEGLNDPELSLLGIKVQSAELWDSSHTHNRISQIAGFVRGTLTGKPMNQEVHGQHIDLH
jgi:general stress protein 26